MNILFLLASLPFTLQTAWVETTSYDGDFRISAPGVLQENIDSIETELGKMAYHTLVFQDNEAGADNLIYMVSYCDYPEGIVFADSSGLVQAFFKETMQTAAFSIDGELLYSSDIQVGTNPGKLWRIDYNDGAAVIKTKAFLVGNRYYALQTVSQMKSKLNDATDLFFDSFRFL